MASPADNLFGTDDVFVEQTSDGLLGESTVVSCRRRGYRYKHRVWRRPSNGPREVDVSRGFPTELLALVRCPHDDGELDGPFPSGAPGSAGSPGLLVDAAVRCRVCGRGFRVEGGILRLLDDLWEPDPESAHEAQLRDSIVGNGDYVEQFRATRADQQFDQMEMRPTLAALAPLRDHVVLELGAGTGRYTVPLAKESRAILAVDFSVRSLETLAAKLPDPQRRSGARVGLVQADVTRLCLAPRAFDRILSTLVSNLPSRAHRQAMYRLAAGSLCADGQFVLSAHHYGLRQRLRHEPVDGRYSEGGIYRHLFGASEISNELQPYFGRTSCRPIQIALPFTYRWPGFPLEAVSRLAERSPLVKRLGFLLLATARRPTETSVCDRPAEPQAQPTPPPERRVA
jgi:SAM-dependent methyltransferase